MAASEDKPAKIIVLKCIPKKETTKIEIASSRRVPSHEKENTKAAHTNGGRDLAPSRPGSASYIPWSARVLPVAIRIHFFLACPASPSSAPPIQSSARLARGNLHACHLIAFTQPNTSFTSGTSRTTGFILHGPGTLPFHFDPGPRSGPISILFLLHLQTQHMLPPGTNKGPMDLSTPAPFFVAWLFLVIAVRGDQKNMHGSTVGDFQFGSAGRCDRQNAVTVNSCRHCMTSLMVTGMCSRCVYI
ncbi:hypothetical protein AG1IA_05958 [Rhizoctonia solani AG-1 IA]|uniref:Uncharacterized protein n=1 Tax=Thanatephorus cucumeris (strain AG1-IA) TaxID=983506 RepID=L8WT86_THACA|nr:hypothetical protein AG1IA_05958 [Rhizoctonia solani AG-1 IA]